MKISMNLKQILLSLLFVGLYIFRLGYSDLTFIEYIIFFMFAFYIFPKILKQNKKSEKEKKWETE